MRTVFAISEGSYSDYRVNVLFTTRELAEAHRAEAYSDPAYAEIEEFYLYDDPPKHIVIYQRTCWVGSDGEVTLDQDTNNVLWEYNGGATLKPLMLADTRVVLESLQVRVTGTDAARVERAFQDRVAQARARQLGLTYELSTEEDTP